jgi:predicted RNase H-like HicB family nuclease
MAQTSDDRFTKELKESLDIQFTTRTFKEGHNFVAHALELDVSSCGRTKEKALDNLNEAIRLFLEEAAKMGTLKQILQECADYGSGTQTRSRDSSM